MEGEGLKVGKMTWQEDTEREEMVIEKVSPSGPDWWQLSFTNGWCFHVPVKNDENVVPKAWDKVLMFGRRWTMVRGMVIEGKVAFYRNEEDHLAWRVSEEEKRDQETKAKFEKERTEMDRRYDALPEQFRRRILSYRLSNPDFRWRYESYEMSCCEDAVRIAAALKTPAAIVDFTGLTWEEQKHRVPDLWDGHSGNSFGFAVRLAWLYVTDPELVAREHGALAVLVGCEEYGCHRKAKG